LVFTEIPGWQHIGGEVWKDIAVQNTIDMVEQYRNHPSIILWGVRINESKDDDEFYARTNAAAHKLDPTRQTGGVRSMKADRKTNIQEDVMTYNDFVHSGENEGCLPKHKVTNDMSKAYMVTEYCGHMFPTKSYDCEDHRTEQMVRHANVINAVAGESDIAGSFGWCMFDYNTHKDFGSGDRICYHGVMDMFRNPKTAAYLYSAQARPKRPEDTVLEVSSSLDIGEHPAGLRGDCYIISNADSVRMYRNDRLLKEYFPQDSEWKFLRHGPIFIDDFIGDQLKEGEGYGEQQAALTKQCLNLYAKNGGKLDAQAGALAAGLMAVYHMTMADAVRLYGKYIGDWGAASREYRFEAIKDGKVVKTLVKGALKEVRLQAETDRDVLIEDQTYDCCEIRIKAVDQNGNVLPYFQEPVSVSCEGPVEIIGPSLVTLRGGMAGVYVKTAGKAGKAVVRLECAGTEAKEIELDVMV
nr:glycoside hydrolase family 2 protein [Lachnospiraceae bacterium]